MGRHLVMGAGPVGRALTKELIAAGEEVTLVSRSGRSAGLGEQASSVDVSDVAALGAVAKRAVAMHNCLNPPSYHRWAQQWPPMASAILQVAENAGAVLVTASNLYGYGPVDGPIRAGRPDAPTESKGQVRAAMTAQALAAHREGRVRAVEVRASDYVGAGVGRGGQITRLVPGALSGRTSWVFGDPDAAHTWTDVQDVARLMARVAVSPQAWGRVWHAPSNAPRSQREVLADICATAGRPAPRVRPIPRAARVLAASLVPMMREVEAISFQFDLPWVMDSVPAQEELGLAPTPWDEVCRRTARG